MEVTAIVLAGGKDRRLGCNKSTELVGGIPVIERVVRQLKPIANRILVVTDKGNNTFAGLRSVEIITDIYPDKGPLGGIYSGLCASQTTANIIVASDMPFLNAELLEHMAKILPSFDGVVPRWPNGRIEPLHAVYSRVCLPAMKKHLESGKTSLIECLKDVHILHLNKRGFSSFDPDFFTFMSLNSEANIVLANQIAATEQLINSAGVKNGGMASGNGKNHQPEGAMFRGA